MADDPMFQAADDPSKPPAEPTKSKPSAEPPADRPDWLPEKYKTVEAFVEGHKSLERRLTEVTTPPDDYEFGEDVDLSLLGEEGVAELKQALKDARVRADTAPEIAKFLAATGPKVVQQQMAEAQRQALADAWGIDIETEEGMQTFENRGQKVVTWARMELGDETVNKYGATPVGIMHLENLLKQRLDNDRIDDTPMSQLPATDDYDRLSEMIMDPRYSTDMAYQRRVDQFRQQLEEKERLASR